MKDIIFVFLCGHVKAGSVFGFFTDEMVEACQKYMHDRLCAECEKSRRLEEAS